LSTPLGFLEGAVLPPLELGGAQKHRLPGLLLSKSGQAILLLPLPPSLGYKRVCHWMDELGEDAPPPSPWRLFEGLRQQLLLSQLRADDGMPRWKRIGSFLPPQPPLPVPHAPRPGLSRGPTILPALSPLGCWPDDELRGDRGQVEKVHLATFGGWLVLLGCEGGGCR